MLARLSEDSVSLPAEPFDKHIVQRIVSIVREYRFGNHKQSQHKSPDNPTKENILFLLTSQGIRIHQKDSLNGRFKQWIS